MTLADGGSTANRVSATVLDDDGSKISITVIISGDHVEIGNLGFSREELLLALGIDPEHQDIQRLRALADDVAQLNRRIHKS